MEHKTSIRGKSALQNVMDAAGLIVSYPVGAYERLAVLQMVAERLTPRHIYTEQAINAFIKQQVHPSAADHVTIRRDLIDYQLLHRTDGGSRYWRGEASVGVLPQVQVGPGTIGPDHAAGDRE